MWAQSSRSTARHRFRRPAARPGVAAISACLTTLVGLAACREEVDRKITGAVAEDDRPLRVAVVNYPLQYFAERLGGDLVEVVFPASLDVDPAELF